MGIKQSLSSIEPDNVTLVPRKGMFTKCQVCGVYDGDTITVLYLVQNTPFKINLRMEGIDAPEIRSKRELEQKAATAVKKWLQNRIAEQKTWYFIPKKWDKYGGRVVGTLHSKKNKTALNKALSVNQEMIDMGIVKTYKGRKKVEWEDQELKKIIEACI